MKKLVYVLIWTIPALFLIACVYQFGQAAWIYVTVEDALGRLVGFAYLIIAIIHALGCLVSSSIAIGATVLVARKKK